MPKKPFRISLIAIGNELIFGSTLDTNSSLIAHQLYRLGADIEQISLIKDDLVAIEAQIKRDAERSDLIITTGGLGPTSDDLTRNAIANAMGVSLTEDANARAKLEELLAKRGRSVNENNLRQVCFPVGAKVIPNRLGTADAFVSPIKNSRGESISVLSLPGIPRETSVLLDEAIIPWVQSCHSDLQPPAATALRCFGLSESHIGSQIESCNLPPQIEVSYRPMFPEILLTFYHRGSAPPEVQQQELATIADKVTNVLGADFVFSKNPRSTLAETVAELMTEKHLTLSAAESCTGGLLAHSFISVPGASKFFRSSVVAYANEAKSAFIAVRPAILDHYGAVSEPVAIEMARGCRFRVGADIGVSITGIAGPDGGSPEKPVGTFWIGISFGETDEAFQYIFPAERNTFRQYCSSLAIDLVRRKILGLPMQWNRL